jgi:carbonic anhydrase/acetyltransferase-like protein (isoleucine patch superfamily)
MSSAQRVHPSAILMNGVIIEGDISIGENTYVGAGSIITSNGGKIEIGSNTVIMENAIIRSSPKFNCRIGDHVLVGPKACITGANIYDCCFIATNATIFHGVELQKACVVAVNGIVHIGTFCTPETFIPINHVAFGNPAKIYAPGEIQQLHSDLNKLGFSRYVYDINTDGLSRAEIYTELTKRFLKQNNPQYTG